MTIRGRDYQRRVVRLGGVSIDRGCGLGAEVAAFCVEVNRADAVGTLGAGELHAALDALDSVGFHCLIVILRTRERGRDGGATKVTPS